MCVCVRGTSVFSAQTTFCAPEKGLVIGVGSKIKVPLGSSCWRHAGRGEWTSLDLEAQKGGEEGKMQTALLLSVVISFSYL